MKDKLVDETEMRKVYNHCLDKRKEILQITEVKLQDVFGDTLSKMSISAEQRTKLNSFLTRKI